jgi:TRAP-type C4-dicarboxylate transport system permease small subunit
MKWRNNLIKMPLKTEIGLQAASKVMAVIAALVLAAMMLLTVADVVGRYFFNHPIKGTWELVGLLLVCAGTWGLGYCQMKKGHISITILLERFSKRVQAIISTLAYLIGLTGFSLICWQMFLLAKKYFLLARGNITDTLELPYFPFMLALSIGAGMMALMLLVNLIHSLAEVARK